MQSISQKCYDSELKTWPASVRQSHKLEQECKTEDCIVQWHCKELCSALAETQHLVCGHNKKKMSDHGGSSMIRPMHFFTSCLPILIKIAVLVFSWAMNTQQSLARSDMWSGQKPPKSDILRVKYHLLGKSNYVITMSLPSHTLLEMSINLRTS